MQHLTDIAADLAGRIVKAKQKNPAEFDGIEANISRMEIAHSLLITALDNGADPQTNGALPGGDGGS